MRQPNTDHNHLWGKRPQKVWKQEQETEIETKMFPILAQTATPPCFCFSAKFVFVSGKCQRNRNGKQFSKGGVGYFRKFWGKICFYLFLFPTLMRWKKSRRDFINTPIYERSSSHVHILMQIMTDIYLYWVELNILACQGSGVSSKSHLPGPKDKCRVKNLTY